MTGLTAVATPNNVGISGIVYWDNLGGAASPVVGTYPSRDTAIVDPPTWFTSVPGTMSVDGRLPTTGFFAAGLWELDPQSASATGSAMIAHGTNTGGDGAADGVRDEPALPRRPRARVADGRVRRVLVGSLRRRRRAAAAGRRPARR